MQYWTQTHVGLKRSNNEDAILAEGDIGLFGVADGMGGHEAGEVASGEAVRAVAEHLSQHQPLVARLHDPNDRDARDRLTTILQEAVEGANRSIHEVTKAKLGGNRMGTTFCGGLVSDRQALIANVGDSRAYLTRGGRLYQLTQDHTMIGEQMRRGLITEEQASRSPFRHVLLKALGTEPLVDPDIVPVELCPGDRLLFCSDGVHGQVGWQELTELMTQPDGERSVHQMIDQANRAGGIDNATAVLIDIGDGTGEHLIDPQAKIHAMWQLPLFQMLEYAELIKVMSVTSTRAWRAGEVVFAEHEPGDEFLVVLQGEFAVVSGGQPLATVPAGAYVGELALVDGGPRSASVLAHTDSTALVIQRDDFYCLLRREPGLASKLLWHFGAHMATVIRDLNAKVREASRPPGRDPRTP